MPVTPDVSLTLFSNYPTPHGHRTDPAVGRSAPEHNCNLRNDHIGAGSNNLMWVVRSVLTNIYGFKAYVHLYI